MSIAMIEKDFIDECRTVADNADLFLRHAQMILPSHYAPSLVLHNASHAYRVLVYCVILASAEKLLAAEADILCTAAVFHDIGRVNDRVDATHGFRSWLKYSHSMSPDKADSDKYETVKALIINHCLEDGSIRDFGASLARHGNLLAVLKDADALDRVRNGKLDVHYLRTDKSKSLVPFALALCGSEKEFHDYIVTNSKR